MARTVKVMWQFKFEYLESELTKLEGVPDDQLSKLAVDISKNTISHGADRLKATVSCEVTA